MWYLLIVFASVIVVCFVDAPKHTGKRTYNNRTYNNRKRNTQRGYSREWDEYKPRSKRKTNARKRNVEYDEVHSYYDADGEYHTNDYYNYCDECDDYHDEHEE